MAVGILDVLGTGQLACLPPSPGSEALQDHLACLVLAALELVPGVCLPAAGAAGGPGSMPLPVDLPSMT